MNFKILFLSLFTLPLCSQDFVVNVSSDTILAGNIVNITFTANNVAGQFEGPDLKDLNVVSGPNTSTSMSMINGDVSQTATYSYGVLCDDIGEITILPGYLDTGNETLETEAVTLLVLPNPEGIIEHPPRSSGLFEFSYPKTRKQPKTPSTPKKKKRKLKKI